MNARAATGFFLLLGFCCFGSTEHLVAPGIFQEGTILFQSVPIEGTVTQSAQLYSLPARRDDYFELILEKSGTDIEVTLSEPEGKTVRIVNCLHSGPLRISEVASTHGAYQLRLQSCHQSKVYKLTLSRQRPAQPVDRHHIRAERLETEGDSLIAEYRADQTLAAFRKYVDALIQWQTVNDRIEIARTLIRIANIKRELGDSKAAAKYLDLALTRPNEVRSLIRAELLIAQGNVFLRQADTHSALENGSEALDLGRSAQDERTQAQALYLLGLTYYQTLQISQAADAFRQVAEISLNLSDRVSLAQALLYLGAVDSDQSQFDSALTKAREALTIFKALNDRRGQAKALTILASMETRLGRKQEALNTYEDARLLLQDSGDLFNEDALLFGMSRTYLDLGDSDAALRSFNLALKNSRFLGDAYSAATALRGMGQCYFAQNDLPNAFEYLNQALTGFRKLNNKRAEAFVLRDIGSVYEAAGDNLKAVDYFKQTLIQSKALGDRRLEASALVGSGHIYEIAGEFSQALEYHEQALRLSDASDDRLGYLNTLYRIAECLRHLGKPEDAIMKIETALEAIEELRSSVANSSLRTSYFASMRQQYELFIDLLMTLRRVNGAERNEIRALEASERSRARTLLDNISETRLSITEGVDLQQLQREASLRTLLDAAIERYSQLRRTNPTAPTIESLGDAVQQLTKEYDELQGQIRVRSPRYAALIHPEPLKLSQIQSEILDDGSLLLEYSVGEESTFLWAVTRNEFSSYILPKRSEIDKKVRRLRELMAARVALPNEKPANFQARIKAAEADYPQAAAELSRILLGPVAEKLGTKRLVIVGEGVLQYLPFAALPTPQTAQSSPPVPLVAEHEIVNLPSASTLAVIRRDAPLRGTPDRTLAVFADPVFEAQDSRVRKPVRTTGGRNTSAATVAQALRGSDAVGPRIDFPRLPSTRQEAEAILAMIPEDRRLAALGFNATKAAAMNPDLKRYRIVHFATHTVLDDDHPDLSSLVLSLVDEKGNSQSGFLRLRDMYNLNLSAELVVLSACETALGKEVKGEGLMSMVRGFMYSGTPRVLASLWKVDDEATAELMKEFYRQLLEAGLAPAAALRQAQITQMQKKSRQSPYYWAGFQLQGEWN
jgi:CHAT domain-containing protein